MRVPWQTRPRGRRLGAFEVGEEAEASLPSARQTRELADVGYERNIICAEWLLGAAHRVRGELAQVESHLEEVLRRCRRINLIELEPNILLELAHLRHAQAVVGARRVAPLWEESLSLAHEALEIADRCEYRLVQADCHNFLGQLALVLSGVEGLEAERLLEEIESLKHRSHRGH